MTREIDIAIAERLRLAVKRAGGRKRVSAKAGICLSTVNNYLRQVTGPTSKNAAKLAAACDVTLEWLINGTEVVAPPVVEAAPTDRSPRARPAGYEMVKALVQAAAPVVERIGRPIPADCPAEFLTLMAVADMATAWLLDIEADEERSSGGCAP
jgi:transcriptional regulator with XRE-family HTH domain